MASPNIVNVTSIVGNTSYLIPANTTANTWTALTPSTNTVNRVDFITASNVTSSAATITVSVNSAISGGGTAYRLVYQVTVPAGSTLVVVDKTTSLYITDSQSVVVTSGTASAIELVASYEAIT
jgi:hypothetical protein